MSTGILDRGARRNAGGSWGTGGGVRSRVGGGVGRGLLILLCSLFFGAIIRRGDSIGKTQESRLALPEYTEVEDGEERSISLISCAYQAASSSTISSIDVSRCSSGIALLMVRGFIDTRGTILVGEGEGVTKSKSASSSDSEAVDGELGGQMDEAVDWTGLEGETEPCRLLDFGVFTGESHGDEDEEPAVVGG